MQSAGPVSGGLATKVECSQVADYSEGRVTSQPASCVQCMGERLHLGHAAASSARH